MFGAITHQSYPASSSHPENILSSGVLGTQSLTFMKELGRKLRYQTREEKVATYLIQRLSMAVQRGNAASILGGLDSRHFT